MARGKFITLEGGEGAGKSTQAKRLAAFLRSQGYEVVLTREVGGAPGAEKIRQIWLEEGEGYWEPLAELFLIFAARREHLAKTVWPALKRGAWVISDRFLDSSYAYQTNKEHGLGPDMVDRLYKIIARNFMPDLTLLLDAPAGIGLKRMKSRGPRPDRYEIKEAAFHRALRKTYLALAQKYKRRYAIIDAGRGVDDVAKDIGAVVVKRFRLKHANSRSRA